MYEHLGVRCVEPGKEFVPEILGDDVVVTREARERRRCVGPIARGGRRQIQAGGPSLGALHKRVHPGRVDSHAGGSQQRGGLGGFHRHVGHPSSSSARCAGSRPSGRSRRVREESTSCEPNGKVLGDGGDRM